METRANLDLISRLRMAFNVLRDRDPKQEYIYSLGGSSSSPMHKTRLSSSTEMSMVASLYNRCAVDVAMIPLRHIRVDQDKNFIENMNSGLNNCLTSSANLDQSNFAFMVDLVMSLFDEGVAAIVPIDTTVDITNNAYDILTMRTARIVEWFGYHVRVEVYNQDKMMKEMIVIPKSKVAIIENPLYSVMNSPNSTLKRLINKLNLLDAIDEQSGSGKLDLIIQVPYAIKGEAKRKLAEERLASIEDQLQNSKHGIAYADGTEKVIQLNRPAENNLMGQIEYLTRMLYGQLGLSEEIFNGTADEGQMLNYFNRTVEPILKAVAVEIRRKFLTQTAMTQGQDIGYFRNPFSLVTASNMAELADKFTRNEILSGNEFRAVLGRRPSGDPGADELRNKNLNQPVENEPAKVSSTKP